MDVNSWKIVRGFFASFPPVFHQFSLGLLPVFPRFIAGFPPVFSRFIGCGLIDQQAIGLLDFRCPVPPSTPVASWARRMWYMMYHLLRCTLCEIVAQLGRCTLREIVAKSGHNSLRAIVAQGAIGGSNLCTKCTF